VWRGHDPHHVEGARAIVVTAAVPPDHRSWKRPRPWALPVVRRADALATWSLAEKRGRGGRRTHGKNDHHSHGDRALTAAGEILRELAGAVSLRGRKRPDRRR